MKDQFLHIYLLNFFNKSEIKFFIILTFVLLIISFKLLYYVPDIENGGDAVRYYKIGIDVSNFDFSEFKKHHFYLRWGVWINSLISNIFLQNNILSYYLANFIPFWIGILIFARILLKYCGLIAVIFFLLIISSDPDLTRASYQLLPMGSAILPLALLLNSIIGSFDKSKEVDNLNIFLITFYCYWLFSIRETFLLFILVFFVNARLYKKINIFILSFFLLYVFESILFKLMFSDFSLLGKFHFFYEDSTALTKTWFEKSKLGRFIDNGIFSRCYKGSLLPSQSIIFFVSFLFSILEIFKKQNTNDSISVSKILSYFILFFFVCNTLFVISLDPLIPGLPHNSRFIAPILPICLLLIIFFISENLDKKNFISVGLIIFLFLNFVSVNIYQALWNYKYFEFKYSSLRQKVAFYNNFPKKVKDNNCINSKFSKRLHYHLKILHNFDKEGYISKFKNKEILKVGKSFVIKSDDKKCKKIILF